MRAYAAFGAMVGMPPALVESALAQADRMAAWPIKKLPGDDHLEPHERRQFEYEHGRRLWDAGDGAPWRLAELHGHMPENPGALLRQLACEQQRCADLYVSKAAGFLQEAVKPDPDTSGRTAQFYANQREAADEAANRAAYFLAIATALTTAADALSRPLAAPRGRSGGLMVAYSFKPGFIEPIRLLEKRQTIRLPRKRHARPGEALQLFTGPRMRPTRLGTALCKGASQVRLDFRRDLVTLDDAIEIQGDDALDSFAIRDGFNPAHRPTRTAFTARPWEYMGSWWRMTHPDNPVFAGVLIDWDDTFKAFVPQELAA